MTSFHLAVNCHAESVWMEMSNAAFIAMKGAKCMY